MFEKWGLFKLARRIYSSHRPPDAVRCGLIASGIIYELKQQKEIIQRVAKEVFAEYGVEVEFCSSPFSRSAMLKQVWHCPRLIERVEIGTMIEIPRAALTADRIATEAQYFNTLRALPFLASGSCKCKHLLPLHKNSRSVPTTSLR